MIMNQFKRAQVIMLPTDKETSIILNPTTKYLCFTKNVGFDIYAIEEYIKSGFIPQHLYIISNDEIKEGDWCLNIRYNNVEKCETVEYGNLINNTVRGYHKKIIATTDVLLGTTLTKKDGLAKRLLLEGRMKSILPQLSQQFIEKYIESYNKGEIITGVLVEYNNGCYVCEGNQNICKQRNNEPHQNLVKQECDSFYSLKINSKDNTITIKKLKDSWNREELELLFKKHENDVIKYINSSGSSASPSFNCKWVKENL